ncbi:MAG: Tfp pilus assembly protein FimT/FimU [Chthoniobacteraceae bacterium]
MPPQASSSNLRPACALKWRRRVLISRMRGFTLAELLVVMALMSLMAMFLGPAVTSFKSNGDFSSAMYKIAGILQEARTYAVANNTYVFVGIAELDAANTAFPQTPASASAGGRVALAAFVSRDGTSVYDIYALTHWTANYGKGELLTSLGKVAAFENLHLGDFGTPPSSGAMARPAVASDYSLGNDECTSSTPFAYPPGTALSGGYKYLFNKVVVFGPQGSARIISDNNGDAVPNVIELGIQPTHGNRVPAVPTDPSKGNLAVIQVTGATGSVKIYQP